MGLKNTPVEYGSVAKFFHWLIFLLVLVMIPLGYLMGEIPDKPLRGQVVNIHKLIGLLLLTVIILRLLWALINVKPKLSLGTPAWQLIAERGVHFLLYFSLILMPLSGWVGAVAAGHPPFLGNFQFNLPIPQSKAIANFAFDDVHIPLAIVIIVLVSIHILAALYHHFIKKDDVLRRMSFHR